MTPEDSARRALDERLSPLEARLRTRAVAAVTAYLAEDLAGREGTPTTLAQLAALSRCTEHRAGTLQGLAGELEEVAVAYQSAAPEARPALLARHLEARAESRREVARDVDATRRWLDFEAVQERFTAEIADCIDELEVSYHALAALGSELTGDDVAVAARGRVLATAFAHAEPRMPSSVRVAALGALQALIARAPRGRRLDLAGAARTRTVLAWALGEDGSRWVRVAALELWASIAPDDLPAVAAELLARRGERDGMVLRRNALRILVASEAGPAQKLEASLLARDDPSEHVRQELCRALARLGADPELAGLTRADASPRVRGVGLLELAGRASADERARRLAEDALRAALATDAAPVALRCACEAIRALATGPGGVCSPEIFTAPLNALADRRDRPPEIVEEAAATLRALEIEAAPPRRAVREALSAALAKLGEGESVAVRLPGDATRRDVERALAVAARGDMTAQLRALGGSRFRLTRGEPRRFRVWRFLHEMAHPMPDKRKGYAHSRARVGAGEIVAPPLGMAEVTPTRVPGERQLAGPAGGWGHFLPRVDDLLATTTFWPRSIALVTSAGTLTVRGPETLWGRVRARVRLPRAYVGLAEMRQRSLAAAEPRERRRYAAAAAELGFAFELGDTDGHVGRERYRIEPHVALRYLLAGVPLAAAETWLRGARSYVLASSGNSLGQLAWVVWVIFAWLTVRAAWTQHRIARARRAIPLTIGGWGTRGKSGSERLKAALFHALRYDVVVKTTGCEAMFIHAMRDLPAQEIFIYRPYDKATIWEQRDVLQVARGLRAQVFLWECMALQPLFVETLQDEWMADPITTLTNAYPDHEDIQGPGGEDVARVIARFAPRRGVTFTTEEQMLPLLREGARAKDARCVAVAPLEADLLPRDLLDRLPYQEHPRNVALVLALAEHLGVDRERALVDIADHVVLDLGVLKTYGPARHRGRALTFCNGMSANERAGFLSSWTRLGLDTVDVEREPGKARVVLVNNRADRVARSRVFAQILVDDVEADHVVLINSNLGGMLQFITEALDAWLRAATVAGEGGTARGLARFDAALRRVGVRAAPTALLDGVRLMLGGLGVSGEAADGILAQPDVARACEALDPELGPALERAIASSAPAPGEDDLRGDVASHATRLTRRLRAARDAREAVRASLERGSPDEADRAFRTAYRALFLDRIAVLWSADATGDQVIDFVARQVAPGLDVRIMGAQNIKGTGLDFVYRWLQIDRARSALERMESAPSSRGEVLGWILSHADWGLLDAREVLAALTRARAASSPDWAAHAPTLDRAIARLTALEREKAARLTATGKAGLWVRALDRVERFVDHLDSVRRTRAVRRIMADLFARRVGHGRAALLVREVVGRQKGGWLAKDLRGWVARRRGRRAR